MKELIIKNSSVFTGTVDDIIKKFENIVESKNSQYINSEASLCWIIRGSILYFDNLDSKFLGEGNDSGIPDKKADHFANNLYRCFNSLKYLSDIWKLNYAISEDVLTLLDVRTILVHSGENVNDVKSLDLKDFKDIQLGRIFHITDKSESLFKNFTNEKQHMEYRLELWADKHDNSFEKRKSKAVVDYDRKKENQKDFNIFMNSENVRNIVLSEIQRFINICENNEENKFIKKLPPKRVVVKEEEENIDFEKLGKLVSSSRRGGYTIENNIHHWCGFGLEKLMKYSKNRFYISEEVQGIIYKKIKETVEQYMDQYANKEINDYELKDWELDVFKVFAEYLPDFCDKTYVHSKIHHFAPSFNTNEQSNIIDVDYLFRFIYATQEALNDSLNLENTPNGIVCDYICKSIQKTIDSKK